MRWTPRLWGCTWYPLGTSPAQVGEGQRGELCSLPFLATLNDNRVPAGKGQTRDEAPWLSLRVLLDGWIRLQALPRGLPALLAWSWHGLWQYHYLARAPGETEDAELFPTGSMDEAKLIRGRRERCEYSYARGSKNIPCLVFSIGTEKPKGMSCSSRRWVSHEQAHCRPTYGQQHLFAGECRVGNVELYNQAQRQMQLQKN